MSKFCGNCGKELIEGQKFCPNCGNEISSNVGENVVQQSANVYNSVSKPKGNHNTYKMVVGILMIILCICLISAGIQSYEDNAALTYTFPGVLGLIAGIITLCSRNNHSLLMPSGIIFIVSAGINFLGIYDISIYSILAIVFGILNIVYLKKI